MTKEQEETNVFVERTHKSGWVCTECGTLGTGPLCIHILTHMSKQKEQKQ